jgi:hypothetical protein
MAADLRDLIEQAEASRAELLRMAAELARRLRAADPEAAEAAAREIQGQRAGLGESGLLEAGVTADVLEHVVDALRGR